MSIRALALAPLLAAVLTVSALASGCGGGGPHEPTDQQRTAIESRFQAYQDAFKKDDPKAVCAQISPSLIDSVGGDKQCEKSVKTYLSGPGKPFVKAAGDFKIDHIEVAGDDSIARLYVVGSPTQLRFKPSGSDWYVLPPPTVLAPPTS